MSIQIPIYICKEIKMINERKGIEQKKENLSADELLLSAKKTFHFLIETASTEPLYSFLKTGEKSLFILDGFSPYFHKSAHTAGYLILTVINEQATLFYWQEREEPNSFENEIITEEKFKMWCPSSLKCFAEIKEKQVWQIIKAWLRSQRSSLTY